MGTPLAFLLAAAAGYLAGTIPVGYLVGKLLAGVDIRTHGSGKTGATNVRRVLGWKGFFLVYFLDICKGLVAALLAAWIVDDPDTWAKAVGGLAAVVGHSWPVTMGFRGGRGVATGTGAMLAMLPQVVLLSALVAVPLVFLSRYVSLGSVAGAVVVPLSTLILVLFFDAPWPYLVYAALGAALIIGKHRDNIERLISGTERRL